MAMNKDSKVLVDALRERKHLLAQETALLGAVLQRLRDLEHVVKAATPLTVRSYCGMDIAQAVALAKEFPGLQFEGWGQIIGVVRDAGPRIPTKAPIRRSAGGRSVDKEPPIIVSVALGSSWPEKKPAGESAGGLAVPANMVEPISQKLEEERKRAEELEGAEWAEPDEVTISREEYDRARDLADCAHSSKQRIMHCPGGRPVVAGQVCLHCDHDYSKDGECPQPNREGS